MDELSQVQKKTAKPKKGIQQTGAGPVQGWKSVAWQVWLTPFEINLKIVSVELCIFCDLNIDSKVVIIEDHLKRN